MPPIFTEPVSFGLNGSDTSYCCNSPVPQQETYRYRSSSERLRSVTNGGTALNPFSSGGSFSGSAGSAGISITFRTLNSPLPFCLSRYQSQTDAERSFSEVTTPSKSVRLSRIVRRAQLEHHLLLGPQIQHLPMASAAAGPTRATGGRTFPPAASRGSTPFSNMLGVPHSLVIIVSQPRCHQKS